MAKRLCPEPGFYNSEPDFPTERKRRPQLKREVLPELYTIERLVAKRKTRKNAEFLVKWENFGADQMTWEPVHHLPDVSVSIFESQPAPDPDWVSEARERLSVILEHGLKTSHTTRVTLEFRHTLLRHLFPQMPLELSLKAFEATKEDLVSAGLGDYLERVVMVTGGARGVQFPVRLTPKIGRSPAFLTAKGDRAPTRQLEKVMIEFNKDC